MNRVFHILITLDRNGESNYPSFLVSQWVKTVSRGSTSCTSSDPTVHLVQSTPSSHSEASESANTPTPAAHKHPTLLDHTESWRRTRSCLREWEHRRLQGRGGGRRGGCWQPTRQQAMGTHRTPSPSPSPWDRLRDTLRWFSRPTPRRGSDCTSGSPLSADGRPLRTSLGNRVSPYRAGVTSAHVISRWVTQRMLVSVWRLCVSWCEGKRMRSDSHALSLCDCREDRWRECYQSSGSTLARWVGRATLVQTSLSLSLSLLKLKIIILLILFGEILNFHQMFLSTFFNLFFVLGKVKRKKDRKKEKRVNEFHSRDLGGRDSLEWFGASASKFISSSSFISKTESSFNFCNASSHLRKRVSFFAPSLSLSLRLTHSSQSHRQSE